MKSNTTTADQSAERLYLAIYERVAAKSDYLQPDGYRQMLPDAAITAAIVSVLTGVLGGIAHGFLGKIGENAADKAGAIMKRLKSNDPKTEELIVVVTELLPVLQSVASGWDEITAGIALELTRRGLRFALAQELARDLVSDIQRETGGKS